MAWDGSGNFDRSDGTRTGTQVWQNARDAGVKIRADDHDTHDQGLADGIGACLTKNNETKPTAHFEPNTDATYDLGSAAKQWRNLYLSGKIVGDPALTSKTDNVTITPASDANVTLSSAQNIAKVRVLVDGSWTSGHSLICDDVDRKFVLINNSSYTATVTSTDATPTTVDVASGDSMVVVIRAGVGAEDPNSKKLDVADYVDIFSSRLLHIQDQKTSGTDGGSSAAGTVVTRDLNTVVTNEISGASLSSNQITLPAGTYYIFASVPAYKADRHKARLYNATAAAYISAPIGTSDIAGNADSTSSRSLLAGKFTLASTSAIEIRQHTQTLSSGNGLGLAASAGIAEVYTDVKIWKVA